MVWVRIRQGKNKNLTALKSNSNTAWFNFQTYIYIYKWAGWSKRLVYCIWVWVTFLFGRKKSFPPKFQSHLITIYVCLIAYMKRLVVEGIVI
jgi:hypothetical protein